MNAAEAWLVIAPDGFTAAFADETRALIYAAKCHGTFHPMVRQDIPDATNPTTAMNIDLQSIFMVGLGCVCGLLGWLGRELWGAVQKLRSDLSALEVKIGTDFVRYDRLQDALKPIMHALDDIRETLKGKADK